MVIYDQEKKKLVQYSSSIEFSGKVVSKLTQQNHIKNFKCEAYTNEHYQNFERNDLTKLEHMPIDNFCSI